MGEHIPVHIREITSLDISRGMDQNGKGNQEIHEPGEDDLCLPGEGVNHKRYQEENYSYNDILGLKQNGKKYIEGDNCLNKIDKVHAG
jgi:hypothetical protein